MSYAENIRENSQIVAEYIMDNTNWEKISKCNPGNKRLDMILYYTMVGNKRVVTTLNGYRLGKVEDETGRLIDWVSEKKNPDIKGLNYSKKGNATIVYEQILDAMYNMTHKLDFETFDDHGKIRYANRKFFKDIEQAIDLDEELDFSSDSDCSESD